MTGILPCTTLKRTNTDEDKLKTLEDYYHKTFFDALRKTHHKVSEQLDKFKKMISEDESIRQH